MARETSGLEATEMYVWLLVGLTGIPMVIFWPWFGKKIGNDFLEGKITLPIILLFQKSNKIERQTLNKFFSQNIRNQDDFNKTLGLIKKYKIIETCKKRADYFSNVAADSLSIFEKNFTIEKLQELSFYIVNRLN